MADGKVIVDTALDATGFKDGLSKMGSLASTGLKATAKVITGVGGALVGLAGYSVKVGSSFDTAMAQVAATSGKTMEELNKNIVTVGDFTGTLSDFAMKMGETTSFSATQSAEALNYMALAGYNAETSVKMLPNVLNLAAAGSMDLATASDMVTDAQSALGLSIDDTSKMVDKMAKASATGNTSVAQLGEAFLTVGGTAKTLHGGVDELSQMLTVIGDNGKKGAEGGTVLRNMILSLTSPTDKASKAMQSLGLQVFDAQGNMRSMPDILQDLNGALDGMSDQERSKVMSEIFNKADIGTVNSLLGTSKKRWDEVADAIDNSKDAAEEMANTQLDNLEGDIKLLGSAAEGLGIKFYHEIDSPLRDIVKNATGYITQLSEAFKSGGINGLVSEIGTVLSGATTKVVSAAPKMVGAATSVISSFLSGIRNAMPEIATGAVEIGTQLVNGIITIIPQFLTAGIELMTGMADGITLNSKILSINIGLAVRDLLKTLSANLPGLMLAGTTMTSSIVEGFSKQMPMMITAAMNCVQSLLNAFINNTPKMLNAGVEMLQSLGQGISEALPNLIPLALQAIISLADGFISNMGNIVDVGISIITGLVEGIVNSIPLLITEVPRIINDFWDAFDANAFKLLSAGVSLIGKLAMGIIQNIPLIIANAGAIVQAIFTTIMHLDLLSAGKGLIKNLGQGIKSMAGSAKSAANNIAKSVWNTIKTTNWLELGAKIIGFLKNGIAGMVGAIASAGGSVAKAGFNAIRNINWVSLGKTVISFLINGIRGMIGLIGSAMKSLAKAGWNTFRSLNWASIGRNVINGIVSGITGAAGRLVSAATNAAKKAFQAAKNFLGIKSPSRLFRDQVGKMIVLGMAEGITKNSGTLVTSMNSANKKLLSSLKSVKSDYEEAAKTIVETYDTTMTAAYKTYTTNMKALITKEQDKLIKQKEKEVEKENDRLKKKRNKNNKDEINARIKANNKQLKEDIKVIKDNAKKLSDAYTTQFTTKMKAAQEKITSQVESIAKATQEKLDSIDSAKESMRSKLAGGALYIGSGEDLELTSLADQIDQMNSYNEALNKLRGKVSADLMSAITDMSIEDGQQFITTLLGMSDEDLAEYDKLYTQRNALASKISKEYYQSAIDTAKKEYADKLQNLFDNTKMELIGKNAMDGVIKGIKGSNKNLSSAAQKVANQFIAAMKKSLGIKSPSKVAQEEVGKWILPGIENGLESTSGKLNNKVKDVAKDMLASFSETGSFDVGSLVSKMIQSVNRQMSSVAQTANVKSNSGSGQVEAVESEKMNFDRMADKFVEAMHKAGIKVQCDGRDFGRLATELGIV